MKSMEIIAGIIILISSIPGLPQPPMEDQHPRRVPAVVPFGPSGGPHGEMGNSLPVTLDITELQKQLTDIGIAKGTTEKAVVIVRNFMAEFEKQLIQVQREELNIKEELLKEKPDLKAIQGIITKKAQFFATIEFAQVKRDVELKALLTQDEFEKWKSVMKVKMHRMMPPGMGYNGNGPEEKPPAPKK
jgi:hypothetical protein